MRVLIVHAHPEPKSFSSTLRAVAETELRNSGHDVVVSDLYEMGFDPVAGPDDFLERREPEYLTYALEQRNGYKSGSLAPDIAAELEKLLPADLLVLNFPIFWFSTPAILKGWIDRVLISGVCYGGRRFYDRGGLRGKRAIVYATLGGREHMFGENAVHGPLDLMLRHILRGTLQYVGLDVLPPFFAFHVPYITDAERESILSDYRAYLGSLDAGKGMPLPSLDGFDEQMRPMSTTP